MMIIMRTDATQEQIRGVVSQVEHYGMKAHLSKGEERTVIGVVGDGRPIMLREPFSLLDGVDRIVPISRPYKLASREFIPENSCFPLDGVQIGGADIIIIAGPCAVESRSQLLEIAWAVREAGAHALRGGVYKPRTSPYSFQGLGDDGLELLAEVRQTVGLPVVTEVMTPEQIPLVVQHADVLQIGARNMQNFSLLRAAGISQHPVLLKRGMSATIEELLMAAEYLLSEGNRRVILCERGIRTFETATRNTTDINAIPVLKSLTHLPVVLDPSHSTGDWQLVVPVASAGIAAGADGVIVEVHNHPELALSDGGQSLKPEKFAELVKQLQAIAQAIGRNLAPRDTLGGSRGWRCRVNAGVTVEPGTENLLSSSRIAILGLGLMGGSLAMALRGQCALLLGCDPNPQAVQLALENKLVDQASTQAAKILPSADLIVLAAPVNAILSLLGKLDGLHPGKAIVLDLGSTKRLILAAMELLPARFDPLGGHPICGKEKSSLSNAESGLYKNAAFVLCRLERTTPRALHIAAQLVQAVGAHPLWMEAQEHDRWIASTSQLPYLLANALAQATPIEAASLIGPGFRSTSRLAGSFAPMMLDVLQTNRQAVLSALQSYTATLSQLEDCLKSGDPAALEEYLVASARKHAALLDRQSPGSHSGEQTS